MSGIETEAGPIPEIEVPIDDAGDPSESDSAVSAGSRWLRVGLGLAVIGGLIVAAKVTGITDTLTGDGLKALLLGAGACGMWLFVGAFGVSNVLQVPGMLFVAAAVFAYGRVAGGALALVGAIVAVSLTFVVARLVGGRALTKIKKPMIRKILSRLEARPIRTIAILRVFFQTAPAVNTALALSSVRFRDYLVGSALGLTVPVAAVMSLSGWLI